jgi:hypothetical protein
MTTKIQKTHSGSAGAEPFGTGFAAFAAAFLAFLLAMVGVAAGATSLRFVLINEAENSPTVCYTKKMERFLER